MMKRTPLRLFMFYFVSFFAGLVLAWVIVMQLAEGIREGQYVLLLMPPLGGMALFHGVFPLLSKIRLGLEFIAIGGSLVYGVGVVMAGAVWLGLIDPGTALVFWLAGVFGPGWWLLSGWAERLDYYK